MIENDKIMIISPFLYKFDMVFSTLALNKIFFKIIQFQVLKIEGDFSFNKLILVSDLEQIFYALLYMCLFINLITTTMNTTIV